MGKGKIINIFLKGMAKTLLSSAIHHIFNRAKRSFLLLYQIHLSLSHNHDIYKTQNCYSIKSVWLKLYIKHKPLKIKGKDILKLKI
jgi:hypothetical protein